MKLTAGGDEQVQFEHAILATGSPPAMPPMLKVDDPRVMDSTGALDLPDIPKSLLVVGGGYIGLELGTVYADARQRGDRRRDDAGPAARRRSRSRRRPREAHRARR